MKFNSFQIKLFMMFLMVFDHLSIIPGLLSIEAVSVLHFITRPVATWFAFTLVEGFMHTHNRWNYCKRLFLFATIMMIGNGIIMVTINPDLFPTFPNIIFALALCSLMLNLFFDKQTIDKIPPILRIGLGTLVTITCALFAEGSFIIPLLVLIFYHQYNKPKARNAWLWGLTLFLAIPALIMTITMNGSIFTFLYNEGWYILVIPFINMYNGKPGKKSKFTQYLFYVFYPLHIWVIYIIAGLVK